MSNAHYHREAGSGTIGSSNKSHLTSSPRSIVVIVLDQSAARGGQNPRSPCKNNSHHLGRLMLRARH